MVVARVLGAVLAIVVCAWFALGIRQAHDIDRASAIVSAGRSVSAAQLRGVDSVLSSAAELNPDSQVNLLRGQVALLAGKRARAAQIFGRLVRDEPMNIQAWVSLAEATTDPGTRNGAIVAIGRLDSPVTRRR